LQSLHALCVDDGRLAAVSFGVAEVEVVVLERSDPDLPNPGHLPSAVFSPLVLPVRVSEDIAQGQVRPRLDEMTLGLVVFQSNLDLYVLAAGATPKKVGVRVRCVRLETPL
jgi:hypothetical protein